MSKEKAPASREKKNTSSLDDKPDSRASQSSRLIKHAKAQGVFTTLDGRSIGILNVAQRVSEMRARGVPIERVGMVVQVDHNGQPHRVAQYAWRGDAARQADFWGY